VTGSCQTDADCTAQVCVNVGLDEEGRCATEEGVVTCDQLTAAQVATTKFEDDSAVTVCIFEFFTCNDATGTCDFEGGGCAEDADCAGNALGEDCLDDGTCGCDAADDCDHAEALGSACGGFGFCGCAGDEECDFDPDSPTCYDGFCGCGADANCADSPAGGTCNTDNGFCGCAVDDDCGGAGDNDTCSEPAANPDVD
jgi:hypothetical protein